MTQGIKEQDGCPGCIGTPLSRRRMLSLSANGFGLTALSALMAEDAYAGLVPTPPTHFQPKVKNVILCFMPGGVSHMDTFDPKPKLNELHGQLSGDGIRTYQGCPWTFKKYGKAGIAVSELFPHIATCVDDLAIVRSMVSNFPLHPRGNILFHTGRNRRGLPEPGILDHLCTGKREQEPARLRPSPSGKHVDPAGRIGKLLQRFPSRNPSGVAGEGGGDTHREPGSGRRKCCAEHQVVGAAGTRTGSFWPRPEKTTPSSRPSATTKWPTGCSPWSPMCWTCLARPKPPNGSTGWTPPIRTSGTMPCNASGRVA